MKSFHWILAIICFPGKVSSSNNHSIKIENTSKSEEPCILLLDSLRGTNIQIFKNLRRYIFFEYSIFLIKENIRYLQHEWKDKKNCEYFEEKQFTRTTLPGHHVKVYIILNWYIYFF